jgi:hypothetical protein
MKTLVAIPSMDTVPVGFVQSLMNMRRVGDVEDGWICSSLIYNARNELAMRAIEGGFDRMLWLDSDQTFEPDFMERLSAHLDNGYEMVSGLYFTRKPPHKPTIFKTCGIERIGEGLLSPTADCYVDYPKDSLFEIAACGFGGVMLTVDLLKRVREKLGKLPFSPVLGFGEDLSFCMRVREVDGHIYCDSGAKMGHIGQYIYSDADASF